MRPTDPQQVEQIAPAVPGARTPFLQRWFVVLAVSVVALVLAVGWFVVLDDQWSQFIHLRGDGLTQAQQQLDRREERLADVRTMVDLPETLDSERVQQVYDALPRGITAPEVITLMDTFAESAGVDVLSIDVVLHQDDPAPVTAVEASGEEVVIQQADIGVVQRATMTVNLRPRDGSYNGIRSFLGALEVFVPLLDLRQFRYESNADSYAMTLTTYYLPASS